jgi:hypothetical protein
VFFSEFSFALLLAPPFRVGEREQPMEWPASVPKFPNGRGPWKEAKGWFSVSPFAKILVPP